LDGSSAVLDYNDILKDIDRAGPHVQHQQPPEEYYDDDNQDEEEVVEEVMIPRHHDQRRRYGRPRRLRRRRPLPPVEKNEPLWAKYKYGIFIVALVAAALYFLVPRLGVWLPRTMTPEGKLNVLGIAIVAMTVGVGFEAGDRFVLSKH